MKRTFSKEFLKEVLFEGIEGAEILENEQFDTSRWSSYHNLVFSFEGKIWETDYSQGLTEMQCESPFENSDDEIKVTEVRKETVISHRWVTV